MIACRFADLEARCRERGYTLDEVRPCIVSQVGDRLVIDETHRAYPRPRRGLGDLVAAGLGAVGVTKERVSKALGRPCKCRERQEALNRLGRRLGVG